MKISNQYLFLIIFSQLMLSSCVNVIEYIPIDVDKSLGENFAYSYENTQLRGGILDSVKNAKVYQYIHHIKDKILISKKIKHKNDFLWKLKIVKDDSTLNAFCIAGGYIYVYTGIIKFLDNEAQLAGVLAHEIAHADNRHTTSQMIKQYGLTMIVSMFLGTDASSFIEIGKELLGLSFSRDDEAQADACAVAYLSETDYDPKQVGGFFSKLMKENKNSPVLELLSTHPASENRVQNINIEWEKLGSKKGQLFENEYAEIKKLLDESQK